MIKHNQDGAISGLAISLCLCVVLLIAAIGFAGWSYSSRQDYKQNSDQKVESAVAAAKAAESAAKDREFIQKEKNPLRTFNGNEAYGGIQLEYPKTWSGAVDDSGKGTNLVEGYFSPNVVPPISDPNSIFALRVQVVSQSYAEVISQFTSLQEDKSHPISITPYALPLVPKTVGVMVTGSLPGQQQKKGVMVVLPLRSQTLKIWTEGSQFVGDFQTIVLPKFNFSP